MIILVDTSAFYALISKSDAFHETASREYEHLVDSMVSFYTTSFILIETAALIQRRLGFSTLEKWMNVVMDPDLFEIIWIDGDTFEKSWALIKTRKTKTLSLVDVTTLLTAKEMDAVIFSFDEDFKKEGAKVLPEVVEEHV